jgi:hypothetical protein
VKWQRLFQVASINVTDMMSRFLVWILLAQRLFIGGHGQEASVDLSGRVSVAIRYEYQLEVNENQSVFKSSSSSLLRLGSITSTNQALEIIDDNLLVSLQEAFPYGDTTTVNSNVPNVWFVNASSAIYSACFTNSDHCSLVRTTLSISCVGEKPENSVEAVAYGLVQDYLSMITMNSSGKITTTYLYPFLVASLAQFQLDKVNRRMGTTEINLMESSFLEVFGAVVAAIEGDVEATDVKFIYQDLLPSNDNSTLARNILSADFKVHGICRECSNTEFAGIVNAVIGANLDAYELRLKANGELDDTTYFRSVNEVTFAVPMLPNELPPIGDESMYDFLPPVAEGPLPLMLFCFGTLIAICILCGGSYFIWKEVNEDMECKDDEAVSTESESDMGEYSINIESDSGMEVEEYDIKEDGDKLVDNSRKALDEYQVETVLSTEDLGIGENQLIRSVTQTYPRVPSQRQHQSSRGYIDPAGRVYSSKQQSTPRTKSAIAGYQTYAW